MKAQDFARFVDGHGSIQIGLDNHGNKGYFYEQYRVAGPESMLVAFQVRYGGSLCQNGRNCKRIWRVTADKAFSLLQDVRPYLVARAFEVDICLRFGQVRRQLASQAQEDGASRREQLAMEAARARQALRSLCESRALAYRARMAQESAVLGYLAADNQLQLQA